MANFKKCLQDQKITLVDTLISTESKFEHKGKAIATWLAIFIGSILLMPYIILIKSCVNNPEPIAVKSASCNTCHNRKSQLVSYFKKAGNKSPEEMAHAVLVTKSTKLLAAMSVAGEKNTPITARNTGYKKQHSGAWQVNEKYWGRVPYDAVGQALQAEKILVELTQEMPIKKALSYYGGDSTDKYQKRVLAELVRVP